MALILSGDTGPSFVQSAAMPTGSVLQVVNGTLNNGGTTSSSTFADTGLSATITPKYATSKILIDINMTSLGKDTSANAYVQFNLLRNGTDILPRTWEQIGAYTNPSTTQNWVGGSGTNYLDSPATTTALTYKVQVRNPANNATGYWSYLSISTITLTEIAG